MNIISGFILAVGIALSGYFIGGSIVKFKKLDRSVEVRGLAERIVDSDQAVWSMNYSASSDQLADVNTRMSVIQNQIIQFLTENGFSLDEIIKDPINISDRTTQEYGQAKGPRFIARGAIKLNTRKVKEVTTASQKADELLKKGVALSSSNMIYYFTDLNSIKPAMLEEATRNAREAAEGFAKNANATVGGIRRAYQGLFSISSPLTEYENESSIKKKIRVVTQVDFYLE